MEPEATSALTALITALDASGDRLELSLCILNAILPKQIYLCILGDDVASQVAWDGIGELAEIDCSELPSDIVPLVQALLEPWVTRFEALKTDRDQATAEALGRDFTNWLTEVRDALLEA